MKGPSVHLLLLPQQLVRCITAVNLKASAYFATD